MPGSVLLEGDRITLRTVERADATFLQRILEPAVRRYVEVMRVPYTVNRWEGYVETVAEDESIVTALVCTEGDPIGEVVFRPIQRNNGRAEIGLWLVPEVWGEGYGTEATAVLIEYGFDDLRLHRITAQPLATNAASKRVLDELGFTHEGTHREAVFADGEYVDRGCHALLEHEWRSRTSR